MRIGILQTGSVPPEMAANHGEYVDMFQRLLHASDPDFTTELWDVNEVGQIPDAPFACDGWLITGSRHGVYDDLPWIDPLKDFLRTAHVAGAPIVGICFGHQILAEALGGQVVKSDRGWGCGVHRYSVKGTAPWLKGAPGQVAIHAMHQDQVVVLPPGVEVVAESPFCPFAALAYGETAFSIQPHPEFDADFERDIVSLRRGALIPEDIAAEAIDSLAQGVDRDLVGGWITRFFRHAAAQRKAA